MGLKTITALAITAVGGWFAADYYGVSLDPRDHLPTDTACYVDKRILHLDQMNSFNMDRTPRMTKNIRFEIDRNRFFVSDSYSPDGASLRDIEALLVTPETIELQVRPGALKNLTYVLRSPDPGCARAIREYFSLSPIVLPRIFD